MGKIVVLETNKKMSEQTQVLLDRVIDIQAESQKQIQRAKLLETELTARLREIELRHTLEKEHAAINTDASEADAKPSTSSADRGSYNNEPVQEPRKTEKDVSRADVPDEKYSQINKTADADAKKTADAHAPADIKKKEEREPAPVITAKPTETVTKPAKEEKVAIPKENNAQAPAAPAKSSPEDLLRQEQEAKKRAIERAAKEASEKRAREQAKFAHLVAKSNSNVQTRDFREPRERRDNNGRFDSRLPRSFDRGQGNAYDKDRAASGRPGFDRPRTDRRAASPGSAGERDKTPVSEFVQAKPQRRVADAPQNKDKERSYERKRSFADDASRKKRAGIKEVVMDGDDEVVRGKRKKRDKFQPAPAPEPIKIEKAVITGDTISVKLFAEKIGKPVAEIIKKLFLLGIMSTINSEIDFDTASLVASEFDIELEQRFEQTAEDVLIAEDKDDAEGDLVTRPPVVTIMGHVDHGKTSLLDIIRKTKVTEGEAGGITQHIGAYTININGRQITFLDTPGHEAFTAMRLRGAQSTDIAILVVAADDGVMPQTIEAINHAKSANVPIIVAINKIDKDTANVERIKQSLTEYALVCEEWGGDTIMVPVSAVTGQGIQELLEMILLQADVLELKANPKRLAKGTIIEARLDKGRGPVATVLVQNGTLRIHDTIVAGTAYGRVRAMLNDEGKSVKFAGPSTPIEVIGFSEVPNAGDVMYAVEQDKLSRQVAEERRDKQKAEKLKTMAKVSLDDLFSQIAEGQIKDLNLIVKADVQGSVEAVKQALEKLSNDEVRVRIIHGAVGAISESDVLLASASNAIIIGFNVRPEASVSSAAEREKVDIRLYRVIYNAIEDVQAALKGMLAPKFEEVVLGHAEIRQTFRVSSVGTIAGCYVQDGKAVRNAKIRLLRDNIVVHEGKLSSLKRFKDDAKEVASGYECGLTIDGYNDLKEGDVVELYEIREIPR